MLDNVPEKGEGGKGDPLEMEEHVFIHVKIPAPSSSSPCINLSIETLSHILSFCDFPSALRFVRTTNRSIRQEFYHDRNHFLWKEFLERHHFSLPVALPSNTAVTTTTTICSPDYLGELRQRRQLARNLLVPKRSRAQQRSSSSTKTVNSSFSANNCCFDIPNRCFYFVPITPDDLFAEEWENPDPPPVDFGCDSFMLTDTACGAELVMLDPFHGTLAIYESCLDNAVASDEGMMEAAMMEAAQWIERYAAHNNNNNNNNNTAQEDHTHSSQTQQSMPASWPDESDLVGAAFDRTIHRNHNVSTHYKKPPFQILFRLDEDIDLEACFPTLTTNADGIERIHYRNPPAEIDVGYHGIDSKCILDPSTGQVVGSMIAVGRMFTIESRHSLPNHHHHRQNLLRTRPEEKVCTELMCWTRYNSHDSVQYPRNQQYGGRKLCRFPWSFRSLDVCSTHHRVYASFDTNDGPLARRTSKTSTRPSTIYSPGVSTVVVYPMVDYPPYSMLKSRPPSANGGSPRATNFQEPICFIRCKAEVTALALDPTGSKLLVGTADGSCEIWSIQHPAIDVTIATRTNIVPIKSSIARAFPETCQNGQVPYKDSITRLDSEDATRTQRKLLSILNRPKIVSFHHPSHCPLSTCGFITLQHSSTDGSSLLFWRQTHGETPKTVDDDDDDDDDAFRIVSMINLPLSGTTRAPRIFFDGRRILVFGQDHIGMIILVYHVLSSNEDIHLFQEKTTREEASGGVYNLTDIPRVRFANRIRHAALGGLQYYESIHMTCNDRFIVVNTKTGNLLSDSASPYAEGLLVIDLS